jgi:outer membrane protein TolC
MKKVFLFVLLITASAEASLWNRERLVQKALAESPGILKAKDTLIATQLQETNASRYWLPTLDLLAVHGRQGVWPTPNPAPLSTWHSETSLLLNESLYDNGESYKKSQIQSLKKDVAELRYRDLTGRLVVDVSSSYFDYCLAEKRRDVTEKYSKELQRQLDWVMAQFHNGIKTRKDYIRFKAQSQRSELDLIRTQKEVESARLLLLEKVGMKAVSEVGIECVLKYSTRLEDLAAVDSAPLLVSEKVLEKQKAISDYQNALTGRKIWPEVFLTSAASYGSHDYIDTGSSFTDQEGSSWNALITLKWNLWDWGVRRRQLEIQEATERIAQHDIESELITARKEWQDFTASKAAFIKSYKLAKDLEKMEKDNFSSIEQDYRMGRVNYLDLVTALSNFLESEVQSLEYDMELQKNIIKVKYYVGKLDE